ncbi:MAG TPA: hypothetical protein VG605_13235, partial [Puia sp.]|nr:hypothetical protein [Puia sp.]
MNIKMWLNPIVLAFCGLLCASARAQPKTISELTLVYDYSAGPDGKVKPEGGASAVHTVYI